MNDNPIDPLVEFDPCPLDCEESIVMIQETEQYLDEQARPVLTAIKKYGWIVLGELGKSGGTLGIRPRP